MDEFLNSYLTMCRGAFSRKATYNWFLIAFLGLTLRTDYLGVSSIIRALNLAPKNYECLLRFFPSSAWSGPGLLLRCIKWLKSRDLFIYRNGRIVINGDETKVPKEGRRMPLVGSIRQTSETSSKPSYFRGHEWSFLGILIGKGSRIFCAPAWADIMQPGISGTDESARTGGIVRAASKLANNIGVNAYLVLDAFYAIGPVFTVAQEVENLTIVTRAKKNLRAHRLVSAISEGSRKAGRPKKYSESVIVAEMHESKKLKFKSMTAKVYGHSENVSIYSDQLFWKPAGVILLFVLAKTSRGSITLICSDVTVNPTDVLELYCSRSLIEVMFERIKNLIHIMDYHFWSKSITAQSRRPKKNPKQTTKGLLPGTQKTKNAIVNFVHVGLVLLIYLQASACMYGQAVTKTANCWLRTPSNSIPSEFIAKMALRNILGQYLWGSVISPITQLIQSKKGEENPFLVTMHEDDSESIA